MKGYNYDSLKEIVESFSGKKLMVIGDLLLDHIIRGEVTRISPEAPVPVVWAKCREEEDEYLPGGSCNVARNLSTLGAEVLLVGVVGRDSKAEKLKALLEQNSVETSGIVTDRTRPTILKTRVFAGRGLHQQVLRIDRETINDLSEEVAKRVESFVKDNINNVDGVIIEDYGKGLITPSLIKSVVKLANKHKKIVAVDPKENHFEYYKNVSVITPNHHEASNAVGFTVDPDDDDGSLHRAGAQLLKEEKAEVILITLGEKGMQIFERGKDSENIKTRAQEVSDVSGAGDTVIAVYTLAAVSGADAVTSAKIANCAAGVVVAKAGPEVVSKKELLSEIKAAME